MRYLTPIPKQFVDQSGIPYSDGTVSVYLSGSDELADIFEDAEGDALCPNPCRLDSNGAWQCFVPGGVPLDYIVQDKHGNVVFPYYNILPGSGDGAVFTVKGTEGEIKVTNRVTASGRREATVGLDTAFKQRVDQVEDDIGDLNEEMRGVEGSIQELGEDLDHLDDRVEEAEGQIGQLSESLAEKKDRQTPVVVGNIPANKTVERIFQNANGEIEVDTQDIEFPASDLVNIQSPEGTLDVSKTTQTGRQDFNMDVADHSIDTNKMKVEQFHYLDVDGTTMSSSTDGHTTILSSLDVVVTTSSTYEEVKSIIDNGKHPVLSDSGVFYRLVGTPAGSIVNGVASVSYDFACFPSGEVTAGEKYEAKVYNLDVSLGWRATKQFDLYTASKTDNLLAGKQDSIGIDPSSGDTTKYLNQQGGWNTIAPIARDSAAGLAPGLPSGTGTSKYLCENGTWVTPPNGNYAYTTANANNTTKTLTFVNDLTIKDGAVFAVLFNNGNTVSSPIFVIDGVNHYVYGSNLDKIAAGSIRLFVKPINTQTGVYLVGEINDAAAIGVNNAGTYYLFYNNFGYTQDDPPKAYPYQPPTGRSETFYDVSQSKSNGVGQLTKMYNVNSQGASLAWAPRANTGYDFIDICIRVAGQCVSNYTSSEIITFELYKNDGSSLSVAGLPELSHYVYIINDSVVRPFTFTLNHRMRYKDFVDKIGGKDAVLNFGFSFASTTSGNDKHTVTVDTIWTSVVYHGDYS